MVIPVKYQEIMLAELHLKHPGIVRTKALARLHVWWLGFYTSCSNISQKLPQKFSKVAQKLLISPKRCSKVAFDQLKKIRFN